MLMSRSLLTTFAIHAGMFLYSGFQQQSKNALLAALQAYAEKDVETSSNDMTWWHWLPHRQLDWSRSDYLRFLTCVSDLLVRYLQCLEVKDLPTGVVCLVGIISHIDQSFRESLTRKFSIYIYPNSRSERLLQESFGMDTVIELIPTTHWGYQYEFLRFLVMRGAVETLRSLARANIDSRAINGYNGDLFCLVKEGESRCEVEQILLSLGLNRYLALSNLMKVSDSLDCDIRYHQILDNLVSGLKPGVLSGNRSGHIDPLLDLLKKPWQSAKYERRRRTVKCFLYHGIYLRPRLFGTSPYDLYFARQEIQNSYMFWSILYRDAQSLHLLLRYGAHANEQADSLFHFSLDSSMFREWSHTSSFTWLEFALYKGCASCTSVLIKHGSDVTRTNGHGQSAVQLAKSNMLAPHPRVYFFEGGKRISYEKDGELLAIVREAFERQHPNSGNFDDYKDPVVESKTGTEKPLPREPESWRYKVVSTIRALVTGFLDFLYRHGLISKPLRGELRKLWRFSFSDLLLMRFLYVVSYVLLFWVSLQQLAWNNMALPRPSRKVAFVIAAFPLALIWIASFLSSDDVRSNTGRSS